MILCDVNVFLNGLFEKSPHHRVCLQKLEQLRKEDESFAISELVFAAVLRIATNPKVFVPTPAPEQIFEYIELWRSHPKAVPILPSTRHWQIFRDLIQSTGIRGSDTTDAYLAALALEHGCEWWTTDKGFERFSGLHWRYLPDTA